MEKLTDKIRICALLQQLMEKRALLTIKLPDKPQPFTSAVIEVAREDDYFILDELKPEKGDELLKQNPSLQVTGQLDGVSLRFDSVISEFGVDNDIPYYKLPIPAETEYHQRRQAVRIKLSAANPLPVTFTSKDGHSFDGEIEDISVGGLRARFKRNLAHTVENGSELNCSFLLPPENKEKVNCNFIIRVIKHEKDEFKPAFLGGQFQGMQKPMERQLQRAIMTLQRTLRQKDAF